MADKKKIGVHGTDEETGRHPANFAKKAAPCPVDSKKFMEKAGMMKVEITGNATQIAGVMNPKEMSTGSLGFHTNGACVITIDGVDCECTWQAQVILKHSKPEARAKTEE